MERDRGNPIRILAALDVKLLHTEFTDECSDSLNLITNRLLRDGGAVDSKQFVDSLSYYRFVRYLVDNAVAVLVIPWFRTFLRPRIAGHILA